MLVESLPDQRLDDSLATHIKILSRLVEFVQHARRDIQVYALNRLNHVRLDHPTLTFEEMCNVLSQISHTRDCICGDRGGQLTSFLHTNRISSFVDFLKGDEVQELSLLIFP